MFPRAGDDEMYVNESCIVCGGKNNEETSICISTVKFKMFNDQKMHFTYFKVFMSREQHLHFPNFNELKIIFD